MIEEKNDFITLLNQDSLVNYKSCLAEFYIQKWKKVFIINFLLKIRDSEQNFGKNLTFEQEFSDYFYKHIDPDINKMGSWVLADYGIGLVTNNQSESFNATVKDCTIPT